MCPREAIRPRAKHIREAFARGIRRRHFRPFSGYPFQALCKHKGFSLLSGVLLNFVIGTSLFLLRNSYCVIGTALLIYRRRHSRSIRPKGIRRRHQLLCNISASRFAQRLSTAIQGMEVLFKFTRCSTTQKN